MSALIRKLIWSGGILAAGVFSAASLAFHYKERIKGYLQDSPSGSYMLDKYRGVTSHYWAQSAISYSIFEPATWRPVEDPAIRALLPETKTIPGLNAREIAQLSHGKPFSSSGWTRSGGDLHTTKYSEIARINRGNVSDLVKAWTYKSGDARWRGNVETNPIVVGNMLYATTPGQFLVALNAETGKEKWRLALKMPARRGLVWWLGNKSYGPRLFVPSTDGVFAVDPANGRIVKDFGHDGTVGSAPVLVAPAVDDGRLLIATNAPSVEAYDPGTGKLLWSRSLRGPVLASNLPDGRTPPKLSGGRPWAGFSVDSDRSALYVATGNPDPHLYGANRPGNNAFSCSVVAIDTRTGALKWDFQEVAHDLWDFDVVSPPILVTVRRYGLPVDAVATVTKIGNTLLLDRDNGRPLFDYRLRRAPTSRVPGEVTAPYQPDLELPEPFLRLEFSRADITDIDPQSRATVERKLRNAEFGFFRPPAVHSAVVTFGVHGGAEWPGGAVDPLTGILYVATNRYPWVLRLFYAERRANPIRSRDREGDRLYQSRCASCHEADRKGKYEDETIGDGHFPSLVGITADRDLTSPDWYERSHEGIPGVRPVTPAELATVGRYLANADRISNEQRSLLMEDAWQLVLDDKGRPGSKPPWGLINAIDLNTGLKLWSKPFGEYADLKARGVPPTGQPNFGGVIVTRGGLIFATGTVDRKVRALNSTSGEELWSYDLPAAGSAPPVTYEIDGAQYLAVVASGGLYSAYGKEYSDEIVAFRLGPSRGGVKKAP